jgi:8-oxo-dGTP pyrophosphatase MutT (NUDIX family)
MKLLTEIYRDEGLNTAGKAITRSAVRGIIIDQRKLLMIYSRENGDYKFPGGGVLPGESHTKALIREVREESGAEVEAIEADFGKVVEYAIPREAEYDIFKMTSYYYLCRIGSVFGRQQLDPYEADLGFHPCWAGVDEALNTNKALIQKNHSKLPRWTRRETFLLDRIKTSLF